MAQFRELEAFAQFSSDMDADTLKQITLGQRLVEVLKQPQYEPMPVGNQVAVIYAVSNGFANAIEPKEVRAWEIKFHDFMNRTHTVLLDKIAAGNWDEAVEKDLRNACEDFAKK